MKTRYLFFFVLFLLFGGQAMAQLDTKHWIPPFYAKPGGNNLHMRKHFVSLSTPSADTIPVYIRDGFGELIDIVEISRTSPKEYTFQPIGVPSAEIYPLNVIPADSLNEKIRSQGLYFESYQPFFVNMRHRSNHQGTSLTSKGQIAKGKRFYSGHVYTRYNTNNDSTVWNSQRRSHFISVMATEDNTVVTFDMIKAPISFIGQTPGEPITVVLDAMESYVIGVDHGDFDDSSINLTNGTRITSTKPIVCNSGSWLSGNEEGQDIGSDQLVPAENGGQEYILVRGLGDESTERPIVIATEDNTDIYINDGVTPEATIDEGEFYIVPESDFTANGNLYILATKKISVFQTLSGWEGKPGPTMGLSFIPPLNCIGAKEVHIPFVHSLSDTATVNIITKTGTSVYVNESTTPITGAQTVVGNPDWVTYAFDTTSPNVIIESDSVMNVGLLNRDDNVGASGYFSGFTLEPVVGLSAAISGSLPCIPGNAMLQVFGFDSYQWYFNEEEIPGATGNTLYPEFAGNYTVEGIDVACGYRFPSNAFDIPYCPSTIGAAKADVNVEETEPGSKIFDIDYRIVVENFAASPTENIQVMENIKAGLPVGATAELIGTPSIEAGVLTGGVNPNFDGDIVRQLLPGSGSLPGSSMDAILLTVRIDMNGAEQDGYLNQVVVTTKDGVTNDGIDGPFNGQDFSHQGSDPDPNGDGDPTEDDENDPTLTCFFSNDITYDQTDFCDTETNISVEIDGVSSGTFVSSDVGLSIDTVTGAIDPSASTAGTYAVTFTVTGRCPKTTTTEVTIVAQPSAGTPIANTEVCAGDDPIDLHDFIDGEDEGGTWTDEDGASIDATYAPSIAGNFDFTYSIESQPCDPVSETFTLNVIPVPNPGQVVGNTNICISEGTADLFAFIEGQQSGGQWLDSDGDIVSPNITLSQAGSYSYTYEVTNDACGPRTTIFDLNIIAIPNAGVPIGEGTICAGELVNLFDYLVDPDLDGNWYDSEGNPVDDEFVVSHTGSHTYTYLIDRLPCESASAEVVFEVVEGPTAGTTNNPNLICLGMPSFNLIDYMSGATIGGIWTDADGTEMNGIFNPSTSGEFTFTYTVTSPECNDIQSELILQVSDNHCNNTQIAIPQGFSPNNDGIGDKWVVKNIENYPNNTLLVFNRWGEEVFSASPYTNTWDGKASGGLNPGAGLPVGTYWYILELGDGSEVRKGYIYLNR